MAINMSMFDSFFLILETKGYIWKQEAHHFFVRH